MLEFNTNSLVIKLNGVEYSIPVNTMSIELGIELAEVEKRKVEFLTKINEKQTIITSIQELIQSGQKMTGDEISAKLSEIDKHSDELSRLNKDFEFVILDYYKAYIQNYEEHKHIIRQIPSTHVWEFISELYYASQGKKKENLPEPILPEVKSPKSKQKPVYVKRGLKKRK